MAATEAERLLRIARRDLRMARRLLLLEQAGVDVRELLPLRAFTTFAVQGHYDDEPEDLGLDRITWSQRAEALIDHVHSLLG